VAGAGKSGRFHDQHPTARLLSSSRRLLFPLPVWTPELSILMVAPIKRVKGRGPRCRHANLYRHLRIDSPTAFSARIPVSDFQMLVRRKEYAEHSLLVDDFFDAGCSSLFNSQRELEMKLPLRSVILIRTQKTRKTIFWWTVMAVRALRFPS